jgi:hypothetical protein
MAHQRDKVSDVIEVLTIMKNEFKKSKNYQNTISIRILATKMVAETELKNNRYKNLTSAKNTIHDALARRLKPDIKGIKTFDILADQWLHNGSMELKNIILGHAASRTQSSIVERFFSNS